MTILKIIQIALTILLVLLLRKLLWCVRSLWCYYHGQELPEPITFLPQQSGRVFERHLLRQEALAEEESEEP